MFFNKNKYDVKPENNRPQKVYGVPNVMKDLEAKYDINPRFNEPQVVYGPPDLMKEVEKERIKNGIELFSANNCEFGGPSHYYYVNELNGSYQFRHGYAADGRYLENNIDNYSLDIKNRDKNYYQDFIKELMPIVENWESDYVNKNFPNDTEWSLKIPEEDIYSKGLHDFPEGYDQVMSIINKYFEVYNSKYDIDPYDNIPQDLYGPPGYWDKYNDINPSDNIPQDLYGPPGFFDIYNDVDIYDIGNNNNDDNNA